MTRVRNTQIPRSRVYKCKIIEMCDTSQLLRTAIKNTINVTCMILYLCLHLYYNLPKICRCSQTAGRNSCSIVSGDISNCSYRLLFLSLYILVAIEFYVCTWHFDSNNKTILFNNFFLLSLCFNYVQCISHSSVSLTLCCVHDQIDIITVITRSGA